MGGRVFRFPDLAVKIVADFHLHSKYSRATSSGLTLPLLARWARYKGVHLLGTGDSTHPLWMRELRARLTETAGGLYECEGTRFIPTTEVNNQFVSGGKTKRIHNVLIFPDLETAEKANRALGRYGDLAADGRPLLHLTARDMVRLLLDLSPEIAVIPAHAWTPHYSIFGANSGFDTVEECFAEETPNIHALETGLSSDPAMNWRLSRLDRYVLISNSDSHSAGRIGREANVFDCEPVRADIFSILKKPGDRRFLHTIEFFPEEGKYHFDGHRNCKTRISPEEAEANGNRCPACGRKATIGVLHRVRDLADRPAGEKPPGAPPFKRLVPLDQIIAEALGFGVQSKTVQQEYLGLVQRVAPELEILAELPEERLREEVPPKIAEGILRVRREQVEILPGYDGEYGQVRIFKEGEAVGFTEKQMTLFG